MSNTNYLVLIQQSDTGISVEAPVPETFDMDMSSSYEQQLPQGMTGNKAIDATAAAMGVRLSVQALSAQLWSGNSDMQLSVKLEFHTENDPVADVRAPILNLMKLVTPTVTAQGLLGSPGPSLDFNAVANALGTGAGQLVNIAKSVSSGAANPGNAINAIGALASSAWSSIKAGYQAQTGGASMTNTSQQVADGSNSIQKLMTSNPTLGTAAYWKTQIKNRVSITIGNYLYFDSVVITQVSNTFMSNFDAQTGLPHNVTVQVAFKPMFMLVQSDLDQLFQNPAGGTTSGNNSYGFSIPSASSIVGGNSFGFTS